MDYAVPIALWITAAVCLSSAAFVIHRGTDARPWFTDESGEDMGDHEDTAR